MYKIYYTIGYGFNHHYPDYRRWLMRVNLTCVILLLAFLQIATAAKAQRISLSKKNAALTEVFKEIRKQSGYDFVYPKDLLKQAKKVSLTVSNVSLDDVLVKCFEGQPFTYKVENKTIVVSEKKSTIIDKVIDYFSAIDVRGKVVDENGEPLQGATVKVKGTAQVTMTDKAGEFFLKGVLEDGVIVIAYLGYKPLELKASAGMGVITMELETSKLDEVKISGGYYETTDRLKTGSIVKVTAKDIERQPVTSPLMALQGRVAGLEIIPASGAAGVAPTIRIRGTNSLRNGRSGDAQPNGNYPLYVIDGVPVSAEPIRSWAGSFAQAGYDPLSTIDPTDIESIEVLKDGDATAIYGSRGANGVILITTKRGVKNSLGTTLNVNIYKGMGQVSKKLNLMNTEEYLAMRKEGIINDGAVPGVYDKYDYDLIYWDTNHNTDWQEVLIGGTAEISNIQSTLSWRQGNTSFRFNGGYHKETMVFPGDFGYNRFSGQLSLNHQSENQKFTMSLSSSLGIDKNQMFGDDGLMMSTALSLAPNAPKIYLEDGSLNWEVHKVGISQTRTWDNPFAYLQKSLIANNLNLINSATFSYELLPGLLLAANAGYSNFAGSEYLKSPISSLPPDLLNRNGSASKVDTKRTSWIVEPKVSFTKAVTGHHFNALAGLTLQSSNGASSIILGDRYISDALLGSLLGAGEFIIVSDRSQEYKYNSVYARIGYDWQNKYVLNFTSRRDGSSRFGTGRKFGNFGSVGTAWIFTEEKAVQKILPFVTFGKLRASYGITGSDQIGDYGYLNLYSILSSPYGVSRGTFPYALYNPDFGWESTNKLEFALEMGLFSNKLSFELNRYRNRSSNQLVQEPLPAMTGFVSVLSNFDATVENTGWELVLRGDVLSSATWKWNTALNFSLPKNKLVKFDGIESSSYKNVYRVGEPLSIQWLYTYKGVNNETGLYEVEDKNNDGLYNDLDRSLIDLSGVRYYGGLNNSVQYKNLYISFLLQFSHQRGTRYMTSIPGVVGANQISGSFAERWQQKGDAATVQRFTDNQGFLSFTNARSSNFNSIDASFIRLKTLSVNYLLPKKWLKRARTQECALFIQGQNLLTLTNYEGLDPETGYALPPLRMLTTGIQLKF